jgi:hypothetical protein
MAHTGRVVEPKEAVGPVRRCPKLPVWSAGTPLNCPRLRIATRYAKARGAYQDLGALWTDADPDIPILKQAEAEDAKLH